MEEVGKYESLQDRIKRLTKNQSSATTLTLQNPQINKFSELVKSKQKREQDSYKSSFAKKRNSSEVDLQKITSKQSKYQIKNVSQIKNTQTSKSIEAEEDIRSILDALTTKYKLNKHQEQQRQGSNEKGNLSHLQKRNQLKRNQSSGDIAHYIERNNFDKITEFKDLTNNYRGSLDTDEPMTKRIQKVDKTNRMGHINKKSLTNLTYHQNFEIYKSENCSKTMNEEKWSSTIKQTTINQRIRTIMNQTDDEKMLKKCKSGAIERVPGRIIKNTNK